MCDVCYIHMRTHAYQRGGSLPAHRMCHTHTPPFTPSAQEHHFDYVRNAGESMYGVTLQQAMPAATSAAMRLLADQRGK